MVLWVSVTINRTLPRGETCEAIHPSGRARLPHLLLCLPGSHGSRPQTWSLWCSGSLLRLIAPFRGARLAKPFTLVVERGFHTCCFACLDHTDPGLKRGVYGALGL